MSPYERERAIEEALGYMRPKPEPRHVTSVYVPEFSIQEADSEIGRSARLPSYVSWPYQIHGGSR